ncbi:MAG: DUF5063 domain-containing protein [Bacteroidales bacterium]|nr:DUF5063 domain-containing protein [Bacteroidales bacterium]MBN2818740.1 DUF5063 domain-containing protein [Bacteroidales bacterium]
MDSLESPVYSRNVVEFVTVANEFTKFLETCHEMSLTDFVDTSHKVLPMVYMKGTLLPKIEESYEEYNEKFVTEEDYTFIQDNLLTKFGVYDTYDEVFDPLRQENDEPAELRLSENFADIYQDLKDFVMQYKVGAEEVMLNAIWECRQAFEQYWGQKIVNAMRALHHLRYSVVDLEHDQDSESDSEYNYNKIDTSNWLISRRQEDYNDEE